MNYPERAGRIPRILLNSVQAEALAALIQHCYQAEYHSFMESASPQTHVFCAISLLKEVLDREIDGGGEL